MNDANLEFDHAIKEATETTNEGNPFEYVDLEKVAAGKVIERVTDAINRKTAIESKSMEELVNHSVEYSLDDDPADENDDD